MLYTKIQPQSFLGSGEEEFQEFLPYMDMAAILFNGTKPFEQIGNTLLTETHVKSGENRSSCKFQTGRYLIITQFYTCI